MNTEELMETHQRRDHIREMLIHTLRSMEGLPAEVVHMLNADAELTQQMRSRLDAVVTAAKGKQS